MDLIFGNTDCDSAAGASSPKARKDIYSGAANPKHTSTQTFISATFVLLPSSRLPRFHLTYSSRLTTTPVVAQVLVRFPRHFLVGRCTSVILVPVAFPRAMISSKSFPSISSRIVSGEIPRLVVNVPSRCCLVDPISNSAMSSCCLCWPLSEDSSLFHDRWHASGLEPSTRTGPDGVDAQLASTVKNMKLRIFNRFMTHSL